MHGHCLHNPLKIPVLIPDSRESGPESGLLRTASTAIESTRDYHPLLLAAKLSKIPKNQTLRRSLILQRNFVAFGVGGHPWGHSP